MRYFASDGQRNSPPGHSAQRQQSLMWGVLLGDHYDLFCQLPEVPLSSASELGNALIEITFPEPQVEATSLTCSFLTPSHSAPECETPEAIGSPNPVKFDSSATVDSQPLLLPGGHVGYPDEGSQEPLHGGTSLDGHDTLCHQQQTQNASHTAQDPVPDFAFKVGPCLTYTVA
jgi:hypothetical protein